ncbi:MAG: metal ABC transporter permease [Clostridia bacterium]|nr:metal ABC transporter permease [Clostridia bacterium]
MTIEAILASPFLTAVVIRSLVVGVLVSLCSALLGVSLVLKRYSMIGDGLSHVGFFALALCTAAGVAGAYTMEASIPIVVLAAVLILRLSRSKKIKGDAACAIVSTGAVAIGTLINNILGVRSSDVCSSLFGSASLVTLTDKDLWLSVVLSVLVLVWYVLCARRIFAVTFDEPFARSAGVHTEGLDMMMAVLTGITIVVGMKMMGAIMISALILFPAMTAMRVTGSFRATVWVSAVVSVVSFLIGFILACVFSLQTGATVVTVQLVMFLSFALAGASKTIRR